MVQKYSDIVSFVNKFAHVLSLVIYAASGEELNPNLNP